MTQKHLGTLCSVFKVFGIKLTSLTKQWMEVFRKEERHRGRKTAVTYMKQLLSIGEQYALHQPFTPLPFRKSDNDGLPKDLYPFRAHLRGTIPERIGALSVLRTVEMLRLPISKDISTVEEPCSFQQDFINSFIDFIPKWVQRLNLIKKLKLPKMKYHFTMRNGPNGPALKSSDADVGAIIGDQKLFEAIQTVSSELDDSFPLVETFKHKPGGIHSKLTQFPEKSGKTRTIAVIDYYSQRALKPLHKGLMGILGSLVSDGTYSHRNVGEYAQQKTKEKSFIACYDLSAFTDRFPSVVQHRLLEALLPKRAELANAFWTLLAERQFTVAWSGETVSYQCGQPMGAYASWALCSLAHHMLVEYSGMGVCKDIKTKYRLIGDDLIIADAKIAQNYERNVQLLGVEINRSKTVISEAHADYSAAEIAKQLFLNGERVSPVTPGLIKSLTNPMLSKEALEELFYKISIRNPEIEPVLFRVLFPKEEKFKTALVLCSNPMDPVVRPENWGNTTVNPWEGLHIDTVKQQFYDIKYASLENKASQLFYECEIGLMEDIDFEADWQLDTSPVEAQEQCAREYLQLIERVEEDIADLMYKGFESDVPLLDELDQIEYLVNPKNPFMDHKDSRRIQRANLIMKTFKSLQ